MKHQIDQLSERLEKAFSKEPELDNKVLNESVEHYDARVTRKKRSVHRLI